jgi:hypothetical protein
MDKSIILMVFSLLFLGLAIVFWSRRFISRKMEFLIFTIIFSATFILGKYIVLKEIITMNNFFEKALVFVSVDVAPLLALITFIVFIYLIISDRRAKAPK